MSSITETDKSVSRVYLGVVHPWQCDSIRHFTTRYYSGMFDDASYHFMHRYFGYLLNDERWSGRGWAEVSQKFEYKKELKSGDLVEIDAAVTDVGTKSLSVRYTMRESGSGAVAATLDSTIVAFDLERRKAIRLPTPIGE